MDSSQKLRFSRTSGRLHLMGQQMALLAPGWARMSELCNEISASLGWMRSSLCYLEFTKYYNFLLIKQNIYKNQY